jgi:DNA (cytosine-5)-methyltransferase 1
MNYLSVCSGIEAATVAWHPLGWHAVGYSEIEPFPCAVLKHHYPSVPNHGDMTQHQGWPHETAVDLLVGGTPCQAFSVAGLRQGLADPRGNLTLVFLGIVAGYRPRWVVWENVPGVLSEKTGAFGAFLGGLAELGYGWAYRVLDAQYFGVAQRRRRVFVVGHLGDWHRAAAVLFERESLSGNPPPRRETGKRVAGTFKSCAGSGGWSNSADHAAAGYMIPEVVGTLSDGAPMGGGLTGRTPTPDASSLPAVATAITCHQVKGGDLTTDNYIPVNHGGFFDDGPTHSLTKRMDSSEDGTGRGTPIVAFAQTIPKRQTLAVAFDTYNQTTDPEVNQTLRKAHDDMAGAGTVMMGMSVRRLTPRECERLQGFPDDYTLVPYRNKPAADGPRYKALGNSMAVPVMRWIGERIALVDSIPSSLIPHPSSL